MSKSYTELLDAPLESFERPKPLPVGTYLTVLETYDATKKSRDRQTPYAAFNVKFLRGGPDMDPADLVDFQDKMGQTYFRTKDFYLTPDAMFRLRNFAENILGLSLAGKSTRQILDEMVGKVYYQGISHTPSKKPGEEGVMYAEFSDEAKAE